MELTSDDPVRISNIMIPDSGTDDSSLETLTWETLESSLDQAAEKGFEGAVLVTRNGKVFLNKAWGLANREKQVKNSTDTVFAVGSAPIDFTHAGILLLKDQGKLDLDDSIKKYFDHVPADKQTITIRHLLTGKSGLLNFHDIETDKNPDHTWIDRDEAVKRILSRKLLFEPGDGSAHSHSAWGLLAAIIEIASGESYQQFTKNQLFKPAGMTDTGFFGEPVPDSRIAIGYGKKSADPNSPPNWGPTSWLVMGSGGQVSTLTDMYRWQVAMQSGEILSAESTRQYIGLGDQIHANGDMFGFEFVHSTNPDQLFMIISNTIDYRRGTSHDDFENLWKQLHQLVKPDRAVAKYSLGIMMELSGNGHVSIQKVVSGSAAERDGLQAGDELLSANEQTIENDPTKILAPFLQDGTPIDFEVVRDNKKLTIRVTPQLKK